MSEFAIARGHSVTCDPSALEGRCDAIIVQDSILAYRLAERYPTAPQLFRAASDLHDVQLPPALPGVVGAVVACSDRVGRRIGSLATRHSTHRLRQPVDTERFVPDGAPAPTPRRAVLLGNYLRGERLEMIRAALERFGVAWEQVGIGGELTCSPEFAIWDADIVVAKGRAALEGMACGKAVFVYDQFGGDGWVTGERYAAMEADNFAGLSGPPIATPTALDDELDHYSPVMGTVNRELAITYHGARAHAHELCALLEHIHAPADLAGAPLRELSRLVRLQWLTEQRAFGHEQASRQAHHRTHQALAQLEQLRAEHDQLAVRTRAIEHELRRLRALSRTRRVRLGLRLGKMADTVRRAARLR